MAVRELSDIEADELYDDFKAHEEELERHPFLKLQSREFFTAKEITPEMIAPSRMYRIQDSIYLFLGKIKDTYNSLFK